MTLVSSPRDDTLAAISPRGRYTLVRELGKGAFGKVYLAYLTTNDDENEKERVYYAIKCVPITKIETKLTEVTSIYQECNIDVRAEAIIARRVAHPNVIRIYESFDDNDRHCIVMDYAEGGDLLEYLNKHRPLSEDRARKFFIQLARALQYIHSCGIIHHDVKLENILLDKAQERIFLADWGFARNWCPGVYRSGGNGSCHYAAPELVTRTPHVGPELDCWSLGVVLYALIMGALPFSGKTEAEIAANVKQGKYPPPDFASPKCAALISSILQINTLRRATMRQILDHPWVTADKLSNSSGSTTCSTTVTNHINGAVPITNTYEHSRQ